VTNFSGPHNYPAWCTNISLEISTHPFQNLLPTFSGGNTITSPDFPILNLKSPPALLSLVSDICYIYIAGWHIILLPSSPVHIQYNIWKFHVHNTKFGAWYLLQLLQATYCSYITSFTILHSIVLHTYPQYLLHVAVQIFQLALVFRCRWCGQWAGTDQMLIGWWLGDWAWWSV